MGTKQPPKDLKSSQLPVLMAVAEVSEDPHLESVFEKCNKSEQRAILKALRAAYDAGQDAADQRTGKLMARIFGGFVGVTPGIDIEGHDDKVPRSRLRDVVKLLASVNRS